MRSLIDSGAPVAFSSDWNVAEMDPLVGLYSAVTRADLEGQDAWNTDETISLAQALRGYTRGSAWANFLDDEVGVLEPGKRADIVIFDEDLTALAESSALLEAAVTHTIADGQIVYELEG